MQIALFGSVREVAGVSLVEVPSVTGDTVRGVLERVFEWHPSIREKLLSETGELRDGVSLFLEGRNVRLLGGLDARVEEARRLGIFPPVAGG